MAAKPSMQCAFLSRPAAKPTRLGKVKLASVLKLEDINQGYADMLEGKNIRGLIVYTDEDRNGKANQK